MALQLNDWTERQGFDRLPQINALSDTPRLKWIVEAEFDARLRDVALSVMKHGKRVITIAGPSSSNKSTFGHRLLIHLEAMGARGLIIAMDDFFKDADAIQPGPDGKKDFEAVDTVDLHLMHQRVAALLKGESVPYRSYNFKLGRGQDREGELCCIPKGGVLILEGIHGLHPAVVDPLGREQVSTVYIAPLTSVSIDRTRPFPASDARLLRRALRDRRTRGRAFALTLEGWQDVQIGEIRHISPLRWNADFTFNTALVFELGPFARVAAPKVHEVISSISSSVVAKGIAERLWSLLRFVRPVADEVFGPISTIREFLGGSEFGDL